MKDVADTVDLLQLLLVHDELLDHRALAPWNSNVPPSVEGTAPGPRKHGLPPSSHGSNPSKFIQRFGPSIASSGTFSGSFFCPAPAPSGQRATAYMVARPARARAIVAWSEYSSSPPTGSPVAMRDTWTPSGLIVRAMYLAVPSPAPEGLVAMMTSRTGAPPGAASPSRRTSSASRISSGPI